MSGVIHAIRFRSLHLVRVYEQVERGMVLRLRAEPLVILSRLVARFLLQLLHNKHLRRLLIVLELEHHLLLRRKRPVVPRIFVQYRHDIDAGLMGQVITDVIGSQGSIVLHLLAQWLKLAHLLDVGHVSYLGGLMIPVHPESGLFGLDSFLLRFKLLNLEPRFALFVDWLVNLHAEHFINLAQE